jgi:hypothetical protein
MALNPTPTSPTCSLSIPNAKTVEDFEALLPWNVKAALAKAELQQSERGKDALT